MAADSVEREILIEASPEVVWGVITEPEQISRWFSDEAEVEGRAGADGTLTWKPGGRGGEQGVRLDRADSGRGGRAVPPLLLPLEPPGGRGTG